MKIGVFDSGIGGLSVANAIEKALPEHHIIFMNDQQHVPYGSKSLAEIEQYAFPIFEALVYRGCEVIVVACNTVSMLLIKKLRAHFDVPFIALEPMVKPAAEATKTGVIAVCATPATLASQRYAELKTTYAKDIKIIEPDCSDWSYMIEHKTVDDQKIRARVTSTLAKNADVIVLGCTHYHWIEKEIKEVVGDRAQVIQPEQATIKQLKRVIEKVREARAV